MSATDGAMPTVCRAGPAPASTEKSGIGHWAERHPSAGGYLGLTLPVASFSGSVPKPLSHHTTSTIVGGKTMFAHSHRRALARAIVLTLSTAPLATFAAEPTVLDTVEVTTSKVPVSLRDTAASVSVVSGEEL